MSLVQATTRPRTSALNSKPRERTYATTSSLCRTVREVRLILAEVHQLYTERVNRIMRQEGKGENCEQMSNGEGCSLVMDKALTK